MDSDLMLTLSAIFLVLCAVVAGRRARQHADRRRAIQTWIDSGEAFRSGRRAVVRGSEWRKRW